MSNETPTIPILLLGDANVGKCTFLARLAQGPSSTSSSTTPPNSPIILELRHPSCRFEFTTLSTWPTHPSFTDRDTSNNAKTTAATEDPATPRPAVIILCYSVSSRRSLAHVRAGWSKLVAREMNWDERAPTMLLGLRRDLRGCAPSETQVEEPGHMQAPRGERSEWDVEDRSGKGKAGWEGQGEGERKEDEWVLPHEGLAVAQELRCDRYAECSAVTGELMREVWEDVVKVSVGTLEGWGGGKSKGAVCCCM